MGTLREERESLKMRLSRAGAGGDRLTIIDHTSGSKLTCTATEAFEVLKAQ